MTLELMLLLFLWELIWCCKKEVATGFGMTSFVVCLVQILNQVNF